MSKNKFNTDICNLDSLNFKVLNFLIEEGEKEFFENETLTKTFYKFKKYKDTIITFNCYLKAQNRAELINKFSAIKETFFKNEHQKLFINDYNFYYSINKININNKSLIKSNILKFDIVFNCNYFKIKEEIIDINNDVTDYSNNILSKTLLELTITRNPIDGFSHLQKILINNELFTFFTDKNKIFINLDDKQIIDIDNNIIKYSGIINYKDLSIFTIKLETTDLLITGRLIINHLLF